MRCPFCHANNDRVIDSRTSEGGAVIRRRRLCLECGKRMTTHERVAETLRLTVVKKDETREPYQRDKMMAGVVGACYKRPVSQEELERLVDEVEGEIFHQFDREVPSQFVGERVMAKLRELDQIAYVRFASVYREFRDVAEFIDEARDVLEKPPDAPGQQSLFEDR